MVTEANWHSWRPENFTPYLDIVLNAFGSNRVMYGSDWPVCLLAAQYAQQLKIVEDYIQSFSDSEKQAIMGENAIRFYNL
ncbi:MAG TPA: amidohydrolase family protein [Cyclobacteriaceae bacterium]|nr:amidohydrolase family protein [Cyclobacteriaceae bacterium]